jgi:hypothetical protein
LARFPLSSARCEQRLAQCGRAIADRAACGGDQSAVSDEAVIDPLVSGQFAGHTGLLQALGEAVAVVEQRVEAADNQMRRG